MPTASRRSLLSTAQPDLERLDVAFGPADVALRRKDGVDAAIEHGALALVARRQPHRHLIADPHAVDVGLFDVGADPQIVGIDQRDDGCPGVDHFARTRGADIDDAVDRGVDLGIGSRTSALVCCAAAAACMCSSPAPDCDARQSVPHSSGRARPSLAVRRPGDSSESTRPAPPQTPSAPGRVPGRSDAFSARGPACG